MKRAPIFACVSLIAASAFAANAATQGKTSIEPARVAIRADGEIGAAEVHIVPSTMQAGSTSMETGGDRWNARGYDLKTLIAQIYGVDVRRIDLAGASAAASGARWDVTLQLPREVDDDTMQRMLEDALERQFKVDIAPESRPVAVYVLTAPNGPGAALHRHLFAGSVAATDAAEDEDDAGEIVYSGRDCPGISSGSISASAGSIGELRRTLEPDLDRLVVDETNLTGSYDFKIVGYANEQELFKLMQTQLGIVVTPAQRTVTVLTVRPTQELQAAL